MEELDQLRQDLRAFAAERDWDQFHTPKNLAARVRGRPDKYDKY